MLGDAKQLSLDDARRAAAGEAAKIAQGKNPQAERRKQRQEPTIEVLWKHWLLHANARKKPRSVAEDRFRYGKHLSRWANRRLGTITKPQVQELHARIGRESGIYAANSVLALLRAMFNKSEEIGYRGDNPCSKIKKFPEQSRDRFLQPDELRRFFTALDTEGGIARDFFLTLLFTGARRSNVQAMRWQDVNLDAGIWRIGDNKSGTPVIVPLVLPVVAVLDLRRQEANGSPWVFPGCKGKPLANPKHAWARIVKAAELTDIRPHDIRRSLGSWMAGQNTSSTDHREDARPQDRRGHDDLLAAGGRSRPRSRRAHRRGDAHRRGTNQAARERRRSTMAKSKRGMKIVVRGTTPDPAGANRREPRRHGFGRRDSAGHNDADGR